MLSSLARKVGHHGARRLAGAASGGEFVRPEPAGPIVAGPIPGPNSRALAAKLARDTLGRGSAFQVLFDAKRSAGNYFADPDGSMLLDVFCHIASMPVGYGNRLLADKLAKHDIAAMVASRPALGVHPSADYPALVERFVELAAPRGHSRVAFMLCGSSSNENAIKMCFMHRMAKLRGGRTSGEMTEEEARTAMASLAPGCPDLSILSFGRAFHGRTLSLLSLTHSKSIHKLDIPAFPWPWAPIPDVRYPADTPEHRAWMKTEEDRCIAEAERLIDERESTSPVAGMIIEPIQAEGGDIQAAHSYYRRLRKLASERDIGFIVDEVQTGVHATGTLWAHEAWQLEKHGLDPPDMVTFAKKMQACGVFVRDDFLPDAPYRIYNTWMGDPVRVVLGISVLETAAELGYAQRVRDAGKVLADGFRAIADGPGAGIVTSVRGRGTFLAFDLPDTPTRDRFNAECLKQGLLTGPCGDRSIRVRPMLCFTPALAEQVVDGFAKVAAQLAAEK